MKNLRKYYVMIWELAVAEFRLRDQGTFFGFLWTLFHPLIYFIVLYGLFKKWMGHHINNFPLYLIVGIVQWTFFSSATSNCITAVIRRANFVKNISFPKEVLVFSSVLAVLFSHILELGILLIFWIIIGKKLTLLVFLLVPILILNVFLTVSIGFILSVIGVYFLDIQRIWGIFMSVGLFLTPIFYSLNLLAPAKRRIILLNPMTHIIQATRNILIDAKLPQFQGLFYVIILSLIVFIIGYAIFKKYEGLFAEKI